MDNMLSAQLTLSFMTTYVLQWLKNSPYFPFMQKDSVTLNRIFSAFTAFFVAMGISTLHSWTPGADGAHTLTLTISIPAWSQLAGHLWLWMQQFVFQEGAFRMFLKDSESNPNTGE